MSNDRHKYRIPFFDNSEKFIGFEDLDILKGVQPYNAGVCYRGEPEQCIGLKDRNGKLIYEGDVLRFTTQIDVCVTFRNGGFVYSLTEDERVAYRLSEVIAKSTQIIGNIHEDQFREVTKKGEGEQCE